MLLLSDRASSPSYPNRCLTRSKTTKPSSTSRAESLLLQAVENATEVDAVAGVKDKEEAES